MTGPRITMRMLVLLALASALSTMGCTEPTAREQFEAEVVPVFEQYCAGGTCHGVAPGSEEAGDHIDWDFLYVRLDDDGTLANLDDAYASIKSRINTVEAPALSTLLRKALPTEADGIAHLAGHQFPDADAPGYQTLHAWITAESGGGEGEARDVLTSTQQLFADAVLPELATNGCLSPNCHGDSSPFTDFDSPVHVDGEPIFSVAAIRKNYDAARMHLFLGGDPVRSRLLRKILPLNAGGIIHRGGNDDFFSSRESPGATALLDWARAEQEEVMGDAQVEPSAIVFVRGPIAAATPFEHDNFVAGTDLHVLEPPEPGGTLRNLTAAAHVAPADVRDPAVSHDATRVAFAMRLASEEAFNIYEIGIDGSGLRQLTHDAGPLPGGGKVANIQPTYGPDGRIFFVSSRAGTLAQGYDVLDTEVWAVEPDSGHLERLTYDPAPAVTPHFIPTGKSYGTLSFTMRRSINRYEAPVFRFPLDHNRAYHGDPEIHLHHGATMKESIVYHMRTLPDGRNSCALLYRENQWRGGQLAIFDRQLGPEIAHGLESEAAVAGFKHAFQIVSDESVAASGVSPGGFYRHPVPLPDGRLLLSHAPGPIDLNDPNAAVDLGVKVVELVQNPDTGETELGEVTVLIDEPGVSEYDAEPVMRRPLEDDPAHVHDWDVDRISDTATLSFRNVNVMQAVACNLTQDGAKPLRGGLTYIRFMEALPVTPEQQLLAPAALGRHGRSRILAEVPLMGQSVYVQLPADTPFRVQYLDAERMSKGRSHNRWLHVPPGAEFPGGTSPELYPRLCAGCHGSLSGSPLDVGGPLPDVITAASVTEATHANLNPRRPLEPVPIGADPITVDFARDVAPLLSRSCAKGRLPHDEACGRRFGPRAHADG